MWFCFFVLFLFFFGLGGWSIKYDPWCECESMEKGWEHGYDTFDTGSILRDAHVNGYCIWEGKISRRFGFFANANCKYYLKILLSFLFFLTLTFWKRKYTNVRKQGPSSNLPEQHKSSNINANGSAATPDPVSSGSSILFFIFYFYLF